MLLYAPEEKFSINYRSARKRFLDLAKHRNARLSRYVVGTDEKAGELSTDIGWFGSDQPSKALLIVSGIHGVEGFAGSAVQLSVMEHMPDLPEGMAMVLVHVLNPYGMQKLRRVNANNVDLNRNFIFDQDQFKGVSDEYLALDPLLNPCKPPSWDFFGLKMLQKRFQMGKSVLTQAVAGGQYELEKGLFFGGKELQPETKAYMEWLRSSPLQSCDQIMVLDLHTGLGRLGEQSLFLRSDSISSQEISASLKKQVLPDARDTNGIAYEHEGGCSGVYPYLFPQASTICLTVEYGTCSMEEILKALRAENQYHHFGDGNVMHKTKIKLKNVFCPYPDIWRKQVVGHGLELVSRSIRYLEARC